MANSDSKQDLAQELGKRDSFSSLQQETFLNLVRTHEQLNREFAQFFKSYGLSDAQYNALRILRGEGKPMHVHQIADRMVFQNTDISRLIERLRAAELVRRDRCGEDQRVVWITLTQKAKQLIRKMDRPLKKLHESQFSQLNDRELATLNKLLFQARKKHD